MSADSTYTSVATLRYIRHHACRSSLGARLQGMLALEAEAYNNAFAYLRAGVRHTANLDVGSSRRGARTSTRVCASCVHASDSLVTLRPGMHIDPWGQPALVLFASHTPSPRPPMQFPSDQRQPSTRALSRALFGPVVRHSTGCIGPPRARGRMSCRCV
ncbi:hypothetical protein B0H13DRAFT_2029172 [Mycena leptocephala]|nr:hypothetical protein B0H13DRAFT_2029172 [Mycena leptocephala]